MGIGSDIYNSLNTDKPGFSARKLSALAGILVSIYITIRYTTPENLDSVLITWLLFILLCLGLVTFSQLAQFKSGQTVTTTESSSESKTVETKP
jgi:hypothetical protein